jgi:hypothetical protein
VSNADRCRRYRIKRHDSDMVRDMVRDMLPEIIQAVAEHFRHGGRHAMSRHAESSPPIPPLGFSLDSLPNPPLIPPSETHVQRRSQSSLPAAPYTEDFERFWKAYPHRIGKKDAFNKLQKAMKAGASLQALLDGIEVYVAHKPADRPYCNPSTWLNQERWKDEHVTNGSGGVSAYRPPSSPPPAPNQHYDG